MNILNLVKQVLRPIEVRRRNLVKNIELYRINSVVSKYSSDEVLDFANMSAKHTRILNQIADRVKYDYTKFVDDFTKANSDCRYIWALPLVSRDIGNDNLFLNICRFELVKSLVDKENIRLIVTESSYQSQAIKGIVLPKIKVISRKSHLIKNRWEITRDTNTFIKREKILRSVSEPNDDFSESFNMIISHALSSQFVGNVYEDRYFNELCDLSDERIRFFPSLIHNTDIQLDEFARLPLTCANTDFLCGYLYLKDDDFNALKVYQKFCNALLKKRYYFNDDDISSLVYESLVIGITSTAAFKGILFYKILQHLKDKGAKIKNFIIWYEGRPSDVMCASAIREIYPESGCVGYEGKALDDMYLGLYISDYQYSSGNAPKRIAVPSEIYLKNSQQFCQNIDVVYVPVLRVDYIWRPHSVVVGSVKTILVLLTGFVDVNRTIIEWLDEYLLGADEDYQIVIKNHPVFAGWGLEDYNVDSVHFNYSFVDGDLNDHLIGKSLVITSTTSSSMQVVYSGVPLIILSPPRELRSTMLPADGFNDLFSVVYEKEEYFEAIDTFLNDCEMDNSRVAGMMTEKTRETVARLFE